MLAAESNTQCNTKDDNRRFQIIAAAQRLRVALDVRCGLCGLLPHFVRTGSLRGTSGRSKTRANPAIIFTATMHASSGRLVLLVTDDVFARQNERQFAIQLRN